MRTASTKSFGSNRVSNPFQVGRMALPTQEFPATQAAPGPRLIRVSTGEEVQLREELTFGREHTHVVLNDDERDAADQRVSRLHARIVLINGNYVLHDQSSRGTTANGNNVKSRMLEEDDLLAFGSTQGDVYDVFTFRVSGLASRHVPPPPKPLEGKQKAYAGKVLDILERQAGEAKGALEQNDFDGVYAAASQAFCLLRKAHHDLLRNQDNFNKRKARESRGDRQQQRKVRIKRGRKGN